MRFSRGPEGPEFEGWLQVERQNTKQLKLRRSVGTCARVAMEVMVAVRC